MSRVTEIWIDMFLSRKQQSNESLQQFWHALKGLASRCESGDIAQTLAHDVHFEYEQQKGPGEVMCRAHH